jgi:hypothetical protein
MQVIVHLLLNHLILIDIQDISDADDYNDVHVVHNLYNNIDDKPHNFSIKRILIKLKINIKNKILLFVLLLYKLYDNVHIDHLRLLNEMMMALCLIKKLF